MNSPICGKQPRREKVRRHRTLNGLDYLEVGPLDQQKTSLERQRFLRVYFLGKAPVELDETNIRIEGGQRIRDIQTVSVEIRNSESSEFDDFMIIKVDKAGDFSTYTLRVVERNEQNQWRPHSAFDPRYDRIDFNFKVDCPNDFDCKTENPCPVEKKSESDINYLAKDYASFRQLILDRLALLIPDWRERHVPDIGVALVEVLAYAGDHLSYYQDAVATEAYLETARLRASVRRHARLVDYRMHEGCNARAWVCLEVETNLPPIEPEEIQFITRLDDALAGNAIITDHDLRQFSVAHYEVFEPLANEVIRLYKDHNKIAFYTWGDSQCCIPKNSTTATLLGEWVPPVDSQQGSGCKPGKEKGEPKTDTADSATYANISPVKLRLKPGDVLFFEEVIGPETGHPEDANPKHRHAVRLTEVAGDVDPLNGQPITHITWHAQDALPFPLCLSVLGPPPDCKFIEHVSIACGNVIPVDHGRTVSEQLDPVPEGEVIECCQDEGRLSDSLHRPGRYDPQLQLVPLTYKEPADHKKPASEFLEQDIHRAVPEIQLSSDDENSGTQQWFPQQDLLSSRTDDNHFVVEPDNDGRVRLRFGNGELGKIPMAGTKFYARYRIGNGLVGNVGAESLSHVVFKDNPLKGINHLRNPMPARGGIEREAITDVKLFAPHAFRHELQRAVIADDYAAIVRREFTNKVQNANARMRWNGSWYEVWVAVDPFGREEAEQALLDEITCRLHRYRRMGHDLVVKSAHRVPLDIELTICVRPNYLRGDVKAELLKVFGNKNYSNGKRGFFHPDNLSFGDAIYLSKIVAEAQSVLGTESVTITKMQRWGESANDEIENGVLPLNPFEIARLDNDPSFPENGILTLAMRGGR